ncbi:MAG: beta-propeller fold lactonase family protein [Gemmatimonadota bacterium]|nr:beta-propeller fold lactonase family protein [Gemmatimonadota bacterium]
MMKAHNAVFGIPLLMVLLAGPADRSSAPVSYAEVQRVLDAKCTRCHVGPDAAEGLRLDSWESVISGSRHGEAVIAFDADNSLMFELVTKLVGGPHPTELESEALTEDEAELLREWIDEGAPGDSGQIPFAEADQLLYAVDQGEAKVSVIDMETNMVIRTVDLQALGFPAFALPHHVAVEPDGSYWYVSLIAGNAVLKFDRENRLVGRIDVEWPGLLALDPTSDRLYVARSMASVNPPHRIGIIRRTDMTMEEMDVFIPRPHALAVARDGRSVFTASLSVNDIAVVNPEQETVEMTTLAGDRPHVVINFAVSPDGRWMVGTTELTSQLFVFDLDRLPDLTPVDAIDVKTAPWHPVFTPDGRWVYVGNNWDNSVTVVDMETREVAAVIEGNGIAQPHGSAVSPDGRYAYIASRNLKMPEGHTKSAHVYKPRYDLGDNAHIGTVIVIDTSTRTIVRIIEIEDYGSGLGTATRRQ